MTRILLGLAGVVLLAITALGLIWLVGQILLGVGAFAVGTAGVLLKLLWFVVVAGLLGGVAYFVSNAWRPAARGFTGGSGLSAPANAQAQTQTQTRTQTQAKALAGAAPSDPPDDLGLSSAAPSASVTVEPRAES